MAFAIYMEAINAAKGHHRAYAIYAAPDLFGDWCIDITYGKIGCTGHKIRHVAPSIDHAAQIIKCALQRRKSSVKRIGTEYITKELVDPEKMLFSHSLSQ